MKMYTDANALRLVGKAWQVRAKLRQLQQSGLTLQEYLRRVR